MWKNLWKKVQYPLLIFIVLSPEWGYSQFIKSSTFGSGSNTCFSSTHSVSGIVGQNIVGRVSNTVYSLLSGYWSHRHYSTTALEYTTTNYPQQLQLFNNYPNPFNASTTISFVIPKPSYVTLKIYNLLGQEVATLIEKELLPGIYSHTWNTVTASSGMYVCVLKVDQCIETKKLLLVK
ncbi:MAG: T9SS type A sorting domain-containing protein [Bacteroidetes bacterium]|nr:T9SS type A sorting domain-containing protein [Bacteroidota bacterium]